MEFRFRSMLNRVVPIILSLIFVSQVLALPRFAVRDNYLCSKCHVNPDGAGLRNDYGAGYYSKDILPMDFWGDFGSEEFTARLNEFIRYGADVRMQYYRYDSDIETTDAIFPMQADIYFGVNPSEELTLYFETGLLQTLASSEIWVQANLLPMDGYLRVGQFLPAYGLRLDDHTAFIRGGHVGSMQLPASVTGGFEPHQGLHWEPEASTIGAEIGLQPGNSILALSVGKSQRNPDYSLALNAAHVFYLGQLNFLAGLSSFHGNYYPGLDPYTYAGVYGGINWRGLSFLGEFDFTSDYSGDGVNGYASYAELNLLILKGVTSIVRFEVYDPDLEHTGRTLQRITLGGEIFPMPYVELKPQIRILTSAADEDFQQTELLIQTHFWF